MYVIGYVLMEFASQRYEIRHMTEIENALIVGGEQGDLYNR